MSEPTVIVEHQGRVTVVDARVLEISGTLDTRLKDCCGRQTRKGTFRFKRTGGRKYWRLQNPHREGLCDKHTCHYYIDLWR